MDTIHIYKILQCIQRRLHDVHAYKKKSEPDKCSGIVKGVNNLFLAGQWLMAPGGITVALVTGKYAVQRILKKMHKSVILNP